MYSDRETDALLELLRAGLWNECPKDLSDFPLSDTEWKLVYRLAHEQTVVGLVSRGVEQLPDALLPPEGLLMRWIAEADAIRARNRRMDKVLVGLTGWMQDNGLQPVVLKGQGIARLYEHPELRECGDIDLYFPEKEQGKRALELIRERGIQITAHADGCRSYVVEGIEVEQHTRWADICHPFLQRELKEWERKYGFHEVPLEGGTIRIPSPTMNLLLLSAHIMKHVIGRGVGLRQLCDMARACERLHVAADGEALRRLSCKAGIGKWNALLFAFLTDVLEMKMDALPYRVILEDSWLIWERVLRGGNFGQYGQGRNAGEIGWRRKLATARAFAGNIGFSLEYAGSEAFWTFARLAAGQIKQ